MKCAVLGCLDDLGFNCQNLLILPFGCCQKNEKGTNTPPLVAVKKIKNEKGANTPPSVAVKKIKNEICILYTEKP